MYIQTACGSQKVIKISKSNYLYLLYFDIFYVGSHKINSICFQNIKILIWDTQFENCIVRINTLIKKFANFN